MITLTTTLQACAVIDHRMGEPGGQCYGFVRFDETGATDPHTMGGPEGGTEAVRVGYTTGLPEGTAELWQGNWGLAWPWHYQTAANVLTEAGILIPRDGKINVQMAQWDTPEAVRANAIDRNVVVKWARNRSVDHRVIAKWRRNGSTGGFIHQPA